MSTLRELPTPALLLDLDVLESNLRRMARRADELGVRLRPHVKTHKCVEIARLQRDAGARGITVSTLEEARLFLEHGFGDMTWAFPVPESRVEEAAEMAGRARLGVLVDGPEAVDRLEETGAPFRVWVKVDCGYWRAGIPADSPRLEEVAGRISGSANLSFSGLLTHAGQAYRAEGREALERVAETERRVMVEAAERLRGKGLEVPAVSVGSTPTAARARSLEGVDEIRPGNYALFDYTQHRLGACGVEDCAVTVLATVVSSRPDAGHCVVDAGALALSLDPGPAGGDPAAGGAAATMGEIFRDYPSGTLHEDHRLVSLSQEHGKVRGSLPWGRRVRILPNHSCLAVACFDAFHVVRGEDVVGRWRIHRGR